ncbi:hypothetical protein TYRP_012166 [Tyrophagus putrescentiae]|nr:hypothetical protein TYRP_012166 [Tyrophagus putrescentiae]
MYSAVEGHITEWHLVHLGARAIGGAGLVMMEATAVERRGRVTPGCCGLWADEQIEPLRTVTAFVKAQGAVPAIQLAHSGRKGARVPPWIHKNQALPPAEAWPIVAPSPIAFGGGNEQVPEEATLEDIRGFALSFSSAAKRALEAGFEIIELHFAHGYLVQSFLSPTSNQRTDHYGGSFENRIRLALEIVAAVKEVLPEDYPLLCASPPMTTCPTARAGAWRTRWSWRGASKPPACTWWTSAWGSSRGRPRRSWGGTTASTRCRWRPLFSERQESPPEPSGGIVSARYAEKNTAKWAGDADLHRSRLSR